MTEELYREQKIKDRFYVFWVISKLWNVLEIPIPIGLIIKDQFYLFSVEVDPTALFGLYHVLDCTMFLLRMLQQQVIGIIPVLHLTVLDYEKSVL